MKTSGTGTKSKHYADEFKRKAVALADEIGQPEAALRLGINHGTLRSWRARGVKLSGMKRTPSPEDKALLEAERENKRLKKKINELEKANAVLKEISVFFSKDRPKSNLSQSELLEKKTKK